MTKWEKIKARLRVQHNIIVDDKFTSTHAGHRMRGGGAFSWWSPIVGTISDIGSQWSMTKLLKSKNKWEITHTNLELAIYPADTNG